MSKEKDKLKINKLKKDKLKLVFAGRYPDKNILSGPGQAAQNIYKEHCRLNNSVFIQYFFDGDKYSYLKKLFGYGELKTGSGTVLTLGLLRVIPVLRKMKPDIIHLITFERFAVIFYLYKILFKVKLIYNSHGVIKYENSVLKKVADFYKLKDNICEKIFLNFSDKIIFPSVTSLELAEKYYKIKDKKIIILPNGITSVFSRNSRKTGTGNRLKAVIHHKNELNDSGLKLLIKAFSITELPIDLYIISDSDLKLPEFKYVNIFISNMMPAVKLAEFYADKDIFLSLNKYDTFSISTAEAMASGLIPVITYETGISRYIENDFNGYSFQYDDINSFCNILKEASGFTLEKKESLSMAAAETANQLGWNKVYKMYRLLYGDLT